MVVRLSILIGVLALGGVWLASGTSLLPELPEADTQPAQTRASATPPAEVVGTTREEATTTSGTFSEPVAMQVGDVALSVAVADTPKDRARGLSYRTDLGEADGLLFVFDEPKRPGFWMREMRFAIDIIWISAEGRVSGIHPELAPETYPETFRPEAPVQYVLEVPSGYAAEQGITVGDRVILPE